MGRNVTAGFRFCISLVLLAAFCSCSQHPTARQNLEAEKNDLSTSLQQTIDDLDARINILQARISQQGTNASDQSAKELHSLQGERSRLNERLQQIGNISSHDWNSFRYDVNQEIDNAKNDLRT
jgi:hypothetical protein